MRKWGIVITAVYALIVLGLVTPGTLLLAGGDSATWTGFQTGLAAVFQSAYFWAAVAIVVCGEAALLFLRVDTSWRRVRPRAHILVSCAAAAASMALLTAAGVWAIGFAARGDDFGNSLVMRTGAEIVGFVATLWVVWGILFYVYLRRASDPVTRALSWLLRGSVLELLIAVPCHIIVRRKDECSAPFMTSFGIATGIAVMLLSFGPSVLLLYKKRLDEYPQARRP
jgi:hypothetical protein